jgi:hypothetical protein
MIQQEGKENQTLEKRRVEVRLISGWQSEVRRGGVKKDWL